MEDTVGGRPSLAASAIWEGVGPSDSLVYVLLVSLLSLGGDGGKPCRWTKEGAVLSVRCNVPGRIEREMVC